MGISVLGMAFWLEILHVFDSGDCKLYYSFGDGYCIIAVGHNIPVLHFPYVGLLGYLDVTYAMEDAGCTIFIRFKMGRTIEP